MGFTCFMYYTFTAINLYFSLTTLHEHYQLLDDKVPTLVKASYESPITTQTPITTPSLAANSTATTLAPTITAEPTSSTPAPGPTPMPTPKRQLTHKELTFVLLAVSFATYGLLRQDVIVIFAVSAAHFGLKFHLLCSLMLFQGLLWILMSVTDSKDPDGIPPGARRYYTTNRGPLVRY